MLETSKKERISMDNIAVVVSNDNKVTPFETIDAIKKAGFKKVFIQWYNKDWNPTQKEQLDYIKKNNLEIIFAHLGYKKINDIWKETEDGDVLMQNYMNDIKTLKENNINMVIMHLTTKNEVPIFNEIGLKRIKTIVDYAMSLGVKVAFENTKIRGYIEYILNNINNENVGFCFDTGHYHAYFNDDFDFEIVKNRIFAVHLHDNDKSDDQHLIPFDGTINWEKVISKLKECKYEGPVTLELCYRNEYLNIPIEEFYKKGYEIGIKLNEMLKK